MCVYVYVCMYVCLSILRDLAAESVQVSAVATWFIKVVVSETHAPYYRTYTFIVIPVLASTKKTN